MRTLEIHNLAKRYGRRQVVSDVSFDLRSGEIVGLLGPNGAGKTTSFYMLVGLVPLDAGHIYLDDLDITRLAMHERAQRGSGYLPQEASIFRQLTIGQNIMAILETRADLSRAERLEKLDELLDEFRIDHIRDSLGSVVSGGERRRAEIARALAAEPAFMLLDEPFAGIDPISVGDIKDVVRSLKSRGIGVLITDHNVRETLAICERAYIVSEGEVIAAGTPDEVMSNPKVRDVYLGHDFKA